MELISRRFQTHKGVDGLPIFKTLVRVCVFAERGEETRSVTMHM